MPVGLLKPPPYIGRVRQGRYTRRGNNEQVSDLRFVDAHLKPGELCNGCGMPYLKSEVTRKWIQTRATLKFGKLERKVIDRRTRVYIQKTTEASKAAYTLSGSGRSHGHSDGRQLRECRSRVTIKTPKCVSSDTL
jgi:hypothetical protein